MGECLIARGGSSIKDPLDDIPITAGYCTILATLKDSTGNICPNTQLKCKDGTRWYNYTTNEAGMALFKCNSGSANFTPNNFINSNDAYAVDQLPVTINIDAVVGTKIAKEIKFRKVNTRYNNYISKNIIFKDTEYIKNVFIVGGGGAGDGGSYSDSGNYCTGGGGGGGAANFAENIPIVKEQIYSLYVGRGGKSGLYNGTQNCANGNSGETTSAFGLSANGGGGAYSYNKGIGGYGLYKGGNGGSGCSMSFKKVDSYFSEAENGVFGGGGGGGVSTDNMYEGGSSFINIFSQTSYYTTGGNAGLEYSNGRNGRTGYGGGGGGGDMRSWISVSSSRIANYSSGGFGGCGRIEFDM